MGRTALTVVLVVFGLLAVTAYLTLFTVYQTQQALVLEFGKPKRLITTPGLNFKIPFIQNVSYFDKRLLDLDSAPQEVIASDQKRLVVDAFARWRITDPLLFYQTVSDERIARSQLGAFLEASLRRVLGSSSFEAVVRDERNALMQRITEQVNAEAKGIGVNVLDVRIKRADLPEANSLAIFRRMQTERQREAAEIRAQGEEASRRIRATADRQVTVLKAEATGESERIRGDGDAEKNRVFAQAFGKDPDFFAFYRSMQAYQSALQSDDTRLLLSPTSQFFQYFNDSAGGIAEGAVIEVPEGVPDLPEIVPARKPRSWAITPWMRLRQTRKPTPVRRTGKPMQAMSTA
ncbi:protease modulator HflC [Methyloceanibacter marginalis]|uniref:protease modulator HflC n=1 Tax=Methyloceanibacter marginalis TaxID=1774971 RepID=UPI00084BF662|nr:protease modulator HflC [Methyloceanibacter marginalis]